MGRVRHVVGLSTRAALIQLPLVLVVVAVNAEQFPIAAVTRVVVVVVILVVHGQQVNGRVIEFPRTAAADPGEQFERLAAVTLVTLLADAPRARDDLVESIAIRIILLHDITRTLPA